jgi:hypothetical protein
LASYKHLSRVFICFFFAVCFVQANTSVPPPGPDSPLSWLSRLWTMPMFRFFEPPVAAEVNTAELFDLVSPFPDASPCLVEPLPVVEDSEALAFEPAAGSSGLINLAGLTPIAAKALGRFERVVASAGGTMILTSAYRPAAYQQHLQEVWDKWMVELRRNDDEGCSELRTEVQEEFARHQLLGTQRPAALSDHTLGLSFDAAVRLPARARLKRRRATVDSLARIAGVRRTAVASDPVHFRVIH